MGRVRQVDREQQVRSQEQLRRQGTGAQQSLAWSAQFTSRWDLNQGQLADLLAFLLAPPPQ